MLPGFLHPPLTPGWHFSTCCVAFCALRRGLNCLSELIVQALSPEPFGQLVHVVVLLVCPSPVRGWGPHGGGCSDVDALDFL